MEELENARNYFKKLKLAEELCNGDTEIAKQVLQGALHDGLIIKGRFKNAGGDKYGLFMVVINRIAESINGIYSIVADYASVYQNKPLTHWKTFLDGIEKEMGEIDYDEEMSSRYSNAMKRFLELKKTPKLIEWIDENAILELTDTFTDITNTVFQSDDMEVMIDFESTTSIEIFEVLGIRPSFS